MKSNAKTPRKRTFVVSVFAGLLLFCGTAFAAEASSAGAPQTGNFLTMPRWSPYVVGAGIGLLLCSAVLLSDKTIGCSAAFAKSAGMVERLFGGAKVCEKPYYKQFVPAIDREWLLVVAIFFGALFSALISGTFHAGWVPSVWAGHFGPRALPRVVTALIGGVFIGFGSRWAGGCTSGHGISGTAQLAVSSWITVACFFIGGIIAAMLLFS